MISLTDGGKQALRKYFKDRDISAMRVYMTYG